MVATDAIVIFYPHCNIHIVPFSGGLALVPSTMSIDIACLMPILSIRMSGQHTGRHDVPLIEPQTKGKNEAPF